MQSLYNLVVLYRHQSAAGDELRWLLRSLRNVTGCNQEPLVFGDPPEWYTGPKVVLAPNGGRSQDIPAKLRAMIDCHLLSDKFVVLCDDNAIVRPIDFDDLWIPRYQSEITTEKEGWLGLRYKTCQWLRTQGLPSIDVSTHWPYGWEKRNLSKTLATIDGLGLLVETVYANQHYQPVKDGSIDFRYLRNGNGVCEDAKVVSYNDTSFQRGVRKLFESIFPDPSPWETGPVPSMPTLGVIEPGTMHACQSLGNPIRVDGKHVIFACSKFGEAALFDGSPNTCETCGNYQMTNRIVKLGKQSQTRVGAGCRRGA